VNTTAPFSRTLEKDRHTRRFAIIPDALGWRVVESEDDTVVREHVVTDWHRVERVRRELSVELSALRAEGWLEKR
jgi:hypothetical protein